jgi:hypothetical protein
MVPLLLGAEEPIVEHPAEDAPLIHEPVTTDEDEVCMNKTPAPAELPAETEIPPHVAESEAPIPTLSEPEVPAAPMQPTEPLPKDPTPEPTPAKVATPTAAATEPEQVIQDEAMAEADQVHLAVFLALPAYHLEGGKSDKAQEPQASRSLIEL